ncbi:MAG: exodeoxyribonuclease III [Hyphomicrobiaceae bacterium]
MKIATWNINGVKARLETVKTWLKEANPDVACLQEIKSVTEAFPSGDFEELGYNVAVHGQKSFNGVAIFSKKPFDEIITGLPGDKTDEQARYIEAVIPADTGIVRIASIYLPNGNPVDSEKYPYKLQWMERLRAHAAALLLLEEPLVLAGDYNVIPEARDVHDPEGWSGDALFHPETHKEFRSLLNLGLTDAFRAANALDHQYTFWDYQKGAWQKNHGIRIDHMLLSPQAADHMTGCYIMKETRGWEKPSDHVPVVLELDV